MPSASRTLKDVATEMIRFTGPYRNVIETDRPCIVCGRLLPVVTATGETVGGPHDPEAFHPPALFSDRARRENPSLGRWRAATPEEIATGREIILEYLQEKKGPKKPPEEPVRTRPPDQSDPRVAPPQ